MSKSAATQRLEGDTPTLRLFKLLEIIAEKDEFLSLQSLVDETQIPKPTLHRMLQQLESANILQRDGDNRHYSSGVRLRRLAEQVSLNSTTHSARNAVLVQLSKELGESCNLTALSGNEVIYVDRVETQAPLRICLEAGSRVPIHCSATGKLFLSGMTKSQRSRLLSHASLEQCTENTITDYDSLEAEIEKVKIQGYAIDNEEFIPGLFCIGVVVPSSSGKSNLCLAVQAPKIRLHEEHIDKLLPILTRAAQKISDIESEAWALK
ncbi:IclR family transcriptional regulator [Vibrio mexicanus]|uniref:IclR family transcriptional regulator n=1 Tax=Vibrio mexicanus TaxID=1004326 RepID=UPI001EE27BB8|nr:IclR family transcriptional regulator [Vibrio mexicanus]